MARGRREQVGLEPDRVEDRVGGESRRDVVAARARRMELHDDARDARRRIGRDVAIEQLALPHRMAHGIEVGHCQDAAACVACNRLGNVVGKAFEREPEPRPLVRIALDRCVPLLRDFQPRQRALEA